MSRTTEEQLNAQLSEIKLERDRIETVFKAEFEKVTAATEALNALYATTNSPAPDKVRKALDNVNKTSKSLILFADDVWKKKMSIDWALNTEQRESNRLRLELQQAGLDYDHAKREHDRHAKVHRAALHFRNAFGTDANNLQGEQREKYRAMYDAIDEYATVNAQRAKQKKPGQ